MKTAIGFNQGQLGDLAINLVAARALKEMYPDIHLTFSINKKYQSAAPIFLHNPLVDDIKIWDGYDDWPTRKDEEYLRENEDAIDLFFEPNPKVANPLWFLTHHHSEETCRMHGLTPPKNLSVSLVRYFDLNPKYSKCVAFAPFTSAGAARDIPFEYAQKIVDAAHRMGLETVQLGLPSAPKLKTTHGIIGGSVFDDVIVAASCKSLVTADTGMNYIMSGYEHHTLGLYNTSCYPVKPELQFRIPKNKNGRYLEATEIRDIPIELVITELSSINRYDY